MAKELKMMSLKELNDLRNSVNILSEKYSNQLSTYGISNTEEYVRNLPTSQKTLLENRMKLVKLLSLIDNVIENKISVYYGEIS